MQRRATIWSETWRLTSLSKTDLARIAGVSAIIGLVFVLFHYLGNTTDARFFGRSTLLWMVHRWNNSGLALGAADYSHAWLIPVVSLAVIWWKRHELIAAPKSISYTGLAVVGLALFLHWMGARAQIPRFSLIGLCVLTWAIPFYLFGWATARLLLFPCSYLIFCVPLNFLDSLTVPLRIYMTGLTGFLLNGLGFHYLQSGTALYSVSGNFWLEIADPCSGIRSLIAMTAITAAYAYLTQRTLLRKWILFAAAVPLAVLGNMVRIVTIALVSEAFGSELGAGLYHEFSGYVIFMAITIPLMIGFGYILDIDYHEAWNRWKRAFLPPT